MWSAEKKKNINKRDDLCFQLLFCKNEPISDL